MPVDVTDVADYLGKKYGGWVPLGRSLRQVQGQVDRHSRRRQRRLHELSHLLDEKAGFKEFPTDLPGFLELCKALKKNNTPAGFALGHATGDANGWVHWLLWAHGGYLVDKNDKIIINSPETAKALEYAKAALRDLHSGHPVVERFLQQQGVPGRRTLSAPTTAFRSTSPPRPTPTEDEGDRRGHGPCALPVGPVGKPTELQLAFPILAFNFTKFPNACKAFIAFMMEAENYNPWLEAAQGYLTHTLNAYDTNPVWTADPKTHGVPRRRQAHAAGERHRHDEREGRGGDGRLHRRRHVRPLLHRPEDAEDAMTIAERAAQAHLPVMILPRARRGRAIGGARTPARHRPDPLRARRIDARDNAKQADRAAIRPRRWQRLRANRDWLGFWFMVPAAAFLILFLAYPLGLGIWLSFTDAKIGRPGSSSASTITTG